MLAEAATCYGTSAALRAPMAGMQIRPMLRLALVQLALGDSASALQVHHHYIFASIALYFYANSIASLRQQHRLPMPIILYLYVKYPPFFCALNVTDVPCDGDCGNGLCTNDLVAVEFYCKMVP